MKKFRNSKVRVKQINTIESKIAYYKHLITINYNTKHKWEAKLIPREGKLSELKSYFEKKIKMCNELYIEILDNKCKKLQKVEYVSINCVTPKSVIVTVAIEVYGEIVDFKKVEFEKLFYKN